MAHGVYPSPDALNGRNAKQEPFNTKCAVISRKQYKMEAKLVQNTWEHTLQLDGVDSNKNL